MSDSVEKKNSRLGDEVDTSWQKDAQRSVQSAPHIWRARIRWDNVAKVVVIHAMAVTGILLVPRAAWPTWLWFCFMYVCSTLGVTAGPTDCGRTDRTRPNGHWKFS